MQLQNCCNLLATTHGLLITYNENEGNKLPGPEYNSRDIFGKLLGKSRIFAHMYTIPFWDNHLRRTPILWCNSAQLPCYTSNLLIW